MSPLSLAISPATSVLSNLVVTASGTIPSTSRHHTSNRQYIPIMPTTSTVSMKRFRVCWYLISDATSMHTCWRAVYCGVRGVYVVWTRVVRSKVSLKEEITSLM